MCVYLHRFRSLGGAKKNGIHPVCAQHCERLFPATYASLEGTRRGQENRLHTLSPSHLSLTVWTANVFSLPPCLPPHTAAAPQTGHLVNNGRSMPPWWGSHALEYYSFIYPPTHRRAHRNTRPLHLQNKGENLTSHPFYGQTNDIILLKATQPWE